MSTGAATLWPRGGWNGATGRERIYAPPFAMFFLAGALNWNVLSGVVLQNMMRGVGFSVAQIAAITAARSIPTMMFLFWGPLVDGASTRRRWFSAGAILMGASLFACFTVPWVPGTLGLIAGLAFTAALGRVLGLTAVKGILATKVRPDVLSRASGWYAIGQGVLGAAVTAGSLWLVTHIPSRTIAIGVSLTVCAGCFSAIFLVPPDQPKPWRYVLGGVIAACRDAWALMRTRKGLLAATVFLTPLGMSYAAGFLSGAIAKDWDVSPDLLGSLAIISAILNGIAAIVAGRLCRVYGPWRIYIVSGIAVAITTLFWSVAPRTPLVFAICVLGSDALYLANWTAVLTLMMTLCRGGASATKAAVFTSIVNLANSPLTIALGAIHDRGGPSAMVGADAAFQAASLILIFGAAWLLGVRPKELEVSERSSS